MRIKTLVSLSLITSVILIGTTSIVGELTLGRLFQNTIDTDVSNLKSALEMEINLKEASSDIFKYVKKRDDRSFRSYQKNTAEFQQHVDAYAANIDTVDEQKNLDAVTKLFGEFIQLSDKLIDVHRRQEDGLQLTTGLFEGSVDALLDDGLQKFLDPNDPQFNDKQTTLLELEVNLHEMISAVRAYIILPTEFLHAKVDDSIHDFDFWLSRFRGMKLNANEAAVASEILARSGELANLSRRIMAYEDTENTLLEELQVVLSNLDDRLDDHLQSDALTGLVAAEQRIETNLASLWIVTLIAAALAILIGRHLLRPMTRALTALRLGTENLAAGQFTRVPVIRRDELGDLAVAFNQMQDDLQNVIVSRDYVESILAAMDNALFVLTSDLRVETVNDAACTLLRYRPGEIEGMYLKSLLVHDDDESTPDRPVTKPGDLDKTLFPNNSRMELRTKNGRTVPVLLSRQVKYINGDKIDRIVVVASDITDIIETETALIAARQEAENSSNAKSNFLASMSHELRTPLNPILGYTELLQQNTDSNITSQQLSYLRNIHSAGTHLHELITNILDLSCIEFDHIRVENNDVDIDETIRSSIEQLAVMSLEKDIQISYLRPADPHTIIFSDPLRIRQVLYNLLSNAIKYNQAGGNIWVTYNREADQRIRVTVRDDGAGVPADIRSDLFQPFSRSQEDAHIAQDGIGIGLSLSKMIIQRLGGDMGYNRMSDGGSEFWFTVPIDAPPDDPFGDTVH